MPKYDCWAQVNIGWAGIVASDYDTAMERFAIKVEELRILSPDLTIEPVIWECDEA